MMTPKLVKFGADHWQDLKTIRLEALEKNPEFFCPSQDETRFTEQDWRRRLENPNAASFGLYVGNDTVGLTGVVIDDCEATNALFVASYIRKEYRRRGYSRLFFESRLDWCRSRPDLRTVTVKCREDNVPSQRVLTKFGFRLVKSEVIKWPDQSDRPCLIYTMALTGTRLIK